VQQSQSSAKVVSAEEADAIFQRLHSRTRKTPARGRTPRTETEKKPGTEVDAIVDRLHRYQKEGKNMPRREAASHTKMPQEVAAQERKKVSDERRRITAARERRTGADPPPRPKGSFPVGEGVTERLYRQERERQERLQQARRQHEEKELAELQQYHRRVTDEAEVLERLTRERPVVEQEEEPQPVLRHAKDVVSEERARRAQEVRALSRGSTWEPELEVEDAKKVWEETRWVHAPTDSVLCRAGHVGKDLVSANGLSAHMTAAEPGDIRRGGLPTGSDATVARLYRQEEERRQRLERQRQAQLEQELAACKKPL